MMIPWPSQPVEVSRELEGHESRFRSAHLWRTAHDFIAMQTYLNVLREFDGAGDGVRSDPAGWCWRPCSSSLRRQSRAAAVLVMF